jgi:hypothetical protein
MQSEEHSSAPTNLASGVVNSNLGISVMESEKTADVMTDGEGPSFDLSKLRGTQAGKQAGDASTDDDLDGLAELVPDVKSRKNSMDHTPMSLEEKTAAMDMSKEKGLKTKIDAEAASNSVRDVKQENQIMSRIESMGVQSSKEQKETAVGEPKEPTKNEPFISEGDFGEDEDDSSSDDAGGEDDKDVNDVLYGGGDYPQPDDVDSDAALSSEQSKPAGAVEESDPNLGLTGEFQNISSGQSLSTATQTHEVRMPMYLPTFKPATGCTNASDFIVRCFVARLRSGITVVKHGRSRWCKSRLRILHIHSDGRSLSWKPAQGEPTSSKRPPKLDLTTCLEVRHAWSPDPQNPMYTGTPILRQKCEAANAHKSFALIFPKRTVDITSVTADQCKVLMEGFSALCFRLQVANLAGRGKDAKSQKMPEEEEVATTASNTLTNNSTVSPSTSKLAAAQP